MSKWGFEMLLLFIFLSVLLRYIFITFTYLLPGQDKTSEREFSGMGREGLNLVPAVVLKNSLNHVRALFSINANESLTAFILHNISHQYPCEILYNFTIYTAEQ